MRLIHFNVVAVGLQAVCNHLQAQLAVWDAVDEGSSVSVGLELEAFTLLAAILTERMNDHAGVLDGGGVGVLEDNEAEGTDRLGRSLPLFSRRKAQRSEEQTSEIQSPKHLG